MIFALYFVINLVYIKVDKDLHKTANHEILRVISKQKESTLKPKFPKLLSKIKKLWANFKRLDLPGEESNCRINFIT